MSEQDTGNGAVSRRTLLSGVVGGFAVSMAGGAAAADPPAPGGRLRPISMAMHIHASFSEGPGSFEAQLDQARRHKVDVVWFTDHDFRVAAHDHRQAVHFDGPSELEGALDWTWVKQLSGDLASHVVEFVDTPSVPDDTGRALRLGATAGAAGGALNYAGRAWNSTYNAAIGDTTLELDVLPEVAGAGAVLTVQIALSHHPERAGRPAGVYHLRYLIGGVDARRVKRAGLVGIVELPAARGEWSRLRLTPVEDVRELWPDLVAGDNALRNLRLGVAVDAGASASFVVDRLVFERSRRQGQAGEDMRAEVLAQYVDEYPDVTFHRAYEVSLVRHLNWFGGDQTLPQFPSPPYRNNDVAATTAMIDFLHGHGGLVCWNHPLDIEKPDTLAKLMIEQNNLGADLVEIGRNPQGELLDVLDIAARNGVVFTAVGVSDDHDGRDWLGLEQRNITYVWAKSTSMQDLIAALGAGRAWFVDPAAYRGSLDIRFLGKPVMGSVAQVVGRSVPLEVVATDLPADAVLEIVTGVVDYAGVSDLTPKSTVRAVPAADVGGGRYAYTVEPGDGAYVRTQVRAADGSIIGVSNPMWLLRRKAPKGVSAARRTKIS